MMSMGASMVGVVMWALYRSPQVLSCSQYQGYNVSAQSTGVEESTDPSVRSTISLLVKADPFLRVNTDYPP